MRTLAAAVIAVAALCCVSAVRAADLSGVWAIDQPAWEQQLDRMVQAMMGNLPPEIAAQMRAQGIDPAATFKGSGAGGLDSTVEFLPDGVIRTSSVEDGVTDDGRWTISGDELRIEVDDAANLEAMVGTVEGDRIILRPIIADDDPELAFMREMIYPLARRR